MVPKSPDMPCADCGKLLWRGGTSLPEGQARCRACRSLANPRRLASLPTTYDCAECGISVTRPATRGQRPKYCSPQCAARASWHRRDVTRGAFTLPRSERLAIYERDGWVCQICSGRVQPDLHFLDPMAPTLDHIEPQSWALVPDHSPRNLRLAHRSCNAKRGDRGDVA